VREVTVIPQPGCCRLGERPGSPCICATAPCFWSSRVGRSMC